MQSSPNDTNARLDRELSKMRLRDAGFWGGWALLIGIALLYVGLIWNKPAETRYVTGIAGESIALTTETGGKVITRVTVEGQVRDVTLPSQLVHPAIGDEVCLRAGEHRFTGHTSYVSVSQTLCDGSDATQSGE